MWTRRGAPHPSCGHMMRCIKLRSPVHSVCGVYCVNGALQVGYPHAVYNRTLILGSPSCPLARVFHPCELDLAPSGSVGRFWFLGGFLLGPAWEEPVSPSSSGPPGPVSGARTWATSSTRAPGSGQSPPQTSVWPRHTGHQQRWMKGCTMCASAMGHHSVVLCVPLAREPLKGRQWFPCVFNP